MDVVPCSDRAGQGVKASNRALRGACAERCRILATGRRREELSLFLLVTSWRRESRANEEGEKADVFERRHDDSF